jgi:NADPH-dependent F420 reductase
MRIAILGGTGSEGSGLALRWSRTGHAITIGSRDSARAREKAEEIAGTSGGAVMGASNAEAAREGDVIVLAVPFAGHRALIEETRASLEGKVVVDTVVPLDFQARHVYAPPSEGSAAEQAQALLGAGAKVVAALHHIAAHDLANADHAIEGDGLFCGDDAEAKKAVAELIAALGARPVDVGGLKLAPILEAVTPLLIAINRKYKTKSSGIRITGI